MVDPFRIRIHYLKGWFLCDALSSIPVELIKVVIGAGSKSLGSLRLVRLFKLFRLVRLLNLKAVQELEQIFAPSVVRLTQIWAVFLLVWHMVNCGYWAVVRMELDNLNEAEIERSEDWLPQNEVRESGWQTQYADALYWGLQALCQSDTYPATQTQNLFTSLISFVGVVVFSLLIGSAKEL